MSKATADGRSDSHPNGSAGGDGRAGNTRPVVAISMGDPAGIGPEIIARALLRDEVHAVCRPVVVGDAATMRRAAGVIARVCPDLPAMRVAPVTRVDQSAFSRDVIDVYDLGLRGLEDVLPGQVSPVAGHAAFEAVRVMIGLAMAGDVDATVTAPIHKEALVAAGHKFPGHTEIFAHYTNTPDYTMMLAEGSFRVVHVSTHVSLRQACDAVTRQRVLKVIELAHEACLGLGIDKPTIGVAGLNPHASDGGLFGTEEAQEIIPAIADARAAGIDASGPHPPDTFFAKAVSGAYDVAVAMYHDQGHIPVKVRGFRYDQASGAWQAVRGINVSLGLPIIRTSVDHGTAFDQAGKGTASDASLIDAIDYAAKMARRVARAGSRGRDAAACASRGASC